MPHAEPPSKNALTAHYLDRLATDLETIATAVRNLTASISDDTTREGQRHTSAEAVRVTAQALRVSTEARDHLLALAARDPHPVPLNRLAALSDLSVNTVRSRLGRTTTPASRTTTAPF